MILLAACAWAGTWDLVVALRSDDRFVPPTAGERVAVSALVADLVRYAPAGAVPPALGERAAALGLALDVAGGVAVLGDAPGNLRGSGLLAVRLGKLDAQIVLQAPHPFHDLRSGEVASAMFDDGGVRALLVATANRYVADGSDPAHAPFGWFQAVTDGLAIGLHAPLFAQIHGFGASGADACAVVSEGATRVDAAQMDRIAAALGPALGCDAVRTGAQVPALAARTNAQGRLLVDRAAFLHLELDLTTRETLRADPARRAAVTALFGRLARGEAP